MESIIKEIFTQSVEILLMAFSLLGFALSFLLTIAPQKVENLNRRFDRSINVDDKLGFLDAPIRTDDFIFRHHIFSGSVLVLGSLFLLVFLFYRMDFDRFASVFIENRRLMPIHEIIYVTLMTAGKIAGVTGMLMGVILLFAAGRIMNLESRMSSPVTTQPLVDKLNERYQIIDRMLLTYPRVFGVAGLAASMFLLYVSGKFLLKGP